MTRRAPRVAATFAALAALPGPSAGQSPEQVAVALERERAAIMALPGVQGAGIGLCDASPCIKVYAADPAALRTPLAGLLGSVPFAVVPAARFEARPGDG